MGEKQGIDFGAFPRQAARVLTAPAAFFREMPKTGGFAEPFAFMLVMAAVTALVDAVLGMLGLKFIISTGMAVVRVVLYPAIIVVAGFVWAGVMLFIWKLVGSQEPYETAYRCVAFLSALMPVATLVEAVPRVGQFLTIVLWVFFYVTATVEVHKVPAQKAWITFGIFGAVVYFIILATGFGSYSALPFRDQETRRMQQKMDEWQKKQEETQRRLEEMQKQADKK